MAIRLRRIDGTMVALCAARTREESGDVYLSDSAHYALAAKFDRDRRNHQGFIDYQPEGALMARAESEAPVCATWSACGHEECAVRYAKWYRERPEVTISVVAGAHCQDCEDPITYGRVGEPGGWCGNHGPLVKRVS